MGKYPGLKESLIEKLKIENCYYESDEVIIDQIIFNIEMMNEAQTDLRERGLLINMTRNPDREPYICPNPASTQYDSKLKNLMSLLNSLGLSKQGKKIILDIANKAPDKDALDIILAEDNE